MPTDWDALKDDQVTFSDLLTTLSLRRFTGPITVHFYKGYPQLYEVGKPRRLKFSRGGLTSSIECAENGVDQGPE
jgi:hypothetical protein